MSFHGHTDLATLHVTSFMKLVPYLGVVHEDTMSFFEASLVDETIYWFNNLGGKEISSFADLVKDFSQELGCWL